MTILGSRLLRALMVLALLEARTAALMPRPLPAAGDAAWRPAVLRDLRSAHARRPGWPSRAWAGPP